METFAILVADIARLMRREFDSRAKAAGITRPQWRTLTVLRNHEGLNQGELADRMAMEPITVCRMVDRLEQSGLIERRTDPTDRRAWKLFLTEKARKLLDELRPTAHSFLDDVLDGVAMDERERVVETLGKVRSNLDQIRRRRN